MGGTSCLPAEARKREGGTGSQFVTGRHFLTGRHLLTGVLIVLVVMGAMPAFGQPATWKRQPTPYSNLFQVPDLKAAAEKPNAPASPQPRVVCGMSVIPVDPNIDPRIFIVRKPDDIQYTIRSIPPPICK